MRAVIYARKSTESEDRQVQSIEDQLKVMRQVAKRDGATVVQELQESKSAKAPYMRPLFDGMLRDISQGKIDIVYVWSLNRIARNPVDGGAISYHLQTGKFQSLRTPDRIYNPSDSALLLAVEYGMATAFVQDLSRNVKRGTRSKVEKGWAPYRPPAGYINNVATHEIDVHPTKFAIIRKAWERILGGNVTVRQVRDEMADMGFVTRDGKSRNGISFSALHHIFKNPFYYGMIRHNGELFPGKHTPMVTEAEFMSVQSLLKRNIPARPSKDLDFLYGGLMRCGVCGCAITASRKVKRNRNTGNHKVYVYYHCTGHKGCPKYGVSEKDLTEKLHRLAMEFKISPEAAQWCKEQIAADMEREASSKLQIERSHQETIKKLEDRLIRLHAMRLDGEISAETYKDLKHTLEADIERSNGLKAKSRTEREEVLNYIERQFKLAESAVESLGSGNKQLVRGIAKQMVENLFLTREKVEIRLNSFLEEIVSFGPLEEGFQSSETGNLSPLHLNWLGLAQNLRTCAHVNVDAKGRQSSHES